MCKNSVSTWLLFSTQAQELGNDAEFPALRALSLTCGLLVLSSSSPPVVQLDQHTLPDGLQSANGSDADGGCGRVIADGRLCSELNTGGTSDLTDCIIPSLGGLQCNWAAGLFTVKRNGQPFHIGFEFIGPVNFTSVELDLFNCPEWGIAAQSITVYETIFDILIFEARISTVLGMATASTTSCTSIVRVAIPLELPQNPTTSYVIVFTFDNASIQWVHIAEVRFLEEEGTLCPTPSSTAGMIIANSDSTMYIHRYGGRNLPSSWHTNVLSVTGTLTRWTKC